MKKTLRSWLAAGILCAAALLAAVVLLLPREELPGWDAPEALSASQSRRVQKELIQIVQGYGTLSTRVDEDLMQEDIDAIEARLLAAGYPTVDTDEIYPEYLGNPESLYGFWEAARDGQDAAQTVIRVSEDGGFWHTYLFQEKGERGCLLTHVAWNGDNSAYVQSCELLPLYDIELADWGIFYYRMYPANDPHYVDYSQLRLVPVDHVLFDLNRKYIIPIGYQMANLFLCDWQEGDWGELALNDLFEYLYKKDTGQRYDWSKSSDWDTPTRILLPAQLFEATVLPYFRISLDAFREACEYDEVQECYPWRPVFGDDLTSRHYVMCEPEVLSQTQNGDGTITLTVQVYSPDLKTDRLFTHEVTVRPLTDGSFQYVGNRVTYVSDCGLPYNMARFDLDA